MKRLSNSHGEMAASYDAVVVGSGYGGGVAASRLARMGLRVAVFERGEELHPGEYPDTPVKALAQTQIDKNGFRKGDGTELFDLRIGPDINVLIGCGLGGTSLINANVALEADSRVFDDPVWPKSLNDDDLKEGFERARAMLSPSPYPGGRDGWPDLNKLSALGQSADALGVALVRPPINVNFTAGVNCAGVHQPACNLCGDCCSGCNTGAKNTTLMNYLPDAVAFGAEIYCGLQVRWLEPQKNGGWIVHYRPLGLGREKFDDGNPTVSATTVVLAAGTLGSTEILLRSREHGLALSDTLGKQFSGNGDVLAFGYNNDRPINGIGFGHKAAGYDPSIGPEPPVGPTITGLIDLRQTENVDDGMVIEEGSIPGGLANFLPMALASAAMVIGEDSDVGDRAAERLREFKSVAFGPYCGAVDQTQTFLAMSHDDTDGSMHLDETDHLRVAWPGVGTKPGFGRVADNLRMAVKANGGTYLRNPIWSELFGHDLVTVHPLGGCPMADDATAGVVDGNCRVFSGASGTAVYPDLLVCDGAVMPRSLGVNPLLTISAVSERAMMRLAAATNLVLDTQKPPPKTPALPLPTIGIRFTERMAGNVVSQPGAKPLSASFLVTIIATDLDRLINDKDHEANLVGTVSMPAVSPTPLRVVGGKWNLLIDDAERVETKLMVYRMPLVASDGRRYLMAGEKRIHDDRGFDLWRDTTTLFVKVHAGDDSEGDLLFEGELGIAPADFLRQMRTMVVTDAPDFVTRLEALGRFGAFFGGRLFQSFGGPFARTSAFDPTAQRIRRPLRTGTPDVHHFDTDDGKTLRFTRYRGGTKGPVILSHGLGVSSLIFAIDTISTNLVEFLYAAGYDVWLLDYRASVELPHVREQFTADDVAAKDYPAAVAFVRSEANVDTVQMVAHCYGAMTFTMAMLRGLRGVRSAVISQIATHAIVPWWPQRLLAWLRAPDIMSMFGIRLLDARATRNRDWLSRSIDGVIGFAYPFRKDDRSRSLTSRRITALYGQLYQLSQLNQATLDAIPEMFGKANISSFRQLTRIARVGHIVRSDGRDDYLGDAALRNFAIPTLFVHGALNRTFSPAGTEKTMDVLSKVNGSALYRRVEIADTGHIDCIFGKHAARDVFPEIVAHLDQTAEVV